RELDVIIGNVVHRRQPGFCRDQWFSWKSSVIQLISGFENRRKRFKLLRKPLIVKMLFYLAAGHKTQLYKRSKP
ncbi:MAG: hypothetical protein COW13_02155, partial [Candidatus Omnitrophica bacterium CG12_big_fil_rev_8_21_14_0_65_50_5]